MPGGEAGDHHVTKPAWESGQARLEPCIYIKYTPSGGSNGSRDEEVGQ